MPAALTLSAAVCPAVAHVTMGIIIYKLVRLDYLVVSPHNAADKHARYMVGRLLFRNSGRMMLLFHDYRGATKTLAVLATATRLLQRKHSCTLLCQVAFTVHDPLKMRLLAKLWPYAGVLHSNPSSAAEARTNSSNSSTNSSSSSTNSSSSSTTAAKSATAEQEGTSSNSRRRGSLMQQCLEGSVPQQHILPSTIRHVSAIAIPLEVSHHHSFTSSRTTDAEKLAQSIASSLSLKGRCRIQSAGGIAALNALTAVALAEYLMRRSQGRSLAMHVGAKKRVEQQVPGSTDWPHVVMYYELTLLVAEGGYDSAPASCLFRKGPVPGGSGQQRQMQQQRGTTESQQQQGELQAQQQQRPSIGQKQMPAVDRVSGESS